MYRMYARLVFSFYPILDWTFIYNVLPIHIYHIAHSYIRSCQFIYNGLPIHTYLIVHSYITDCSFIYTYNPYIYTILPIHIYYNVHSYIQRIVHVTYTEFIPRHPFCSLSLSSLYFILYFLISFLFTSYDIFFHFFSLTSD